MLTVEVNGNIYEQALSVSVTRSLQNFMGHFSVQSSPDPQNVLPVSIGDSVKVLADGAPVFNGFIDRLRMNQSDDDHTISFAGRDRTSDVYDSSVFGQKSFQGPINFVSILQNVLSAGNITDISVIDEVGNIEDFSAQEIAGAEVGQSIFEFLEPYARKQQFIMTTNEDGNILLMRAGTERLGVDLTRLVSGNENNILRSSLEIDIERRYNRYIARSQLNPYDQSADATPDIISDQSGEAGIDTDIRASRILEFNTEEDLNDTASFNRAQFEANIRRAKSLDYRCTVQGNSIQGQPFKINRLAFVRDEFAQIASDMLVHTVQLDYSLAQGSTTTLSMTYPDAFTLDAQQNARSAARSALGEEF